MFREGRAPSARSRPRGYFGGSSHFSKNRLVYAPAPMDLVVYAIILSLFASWFSVHVLLCVRLTRVVWWRGLLSFVAFPLAPFWAQAQRIRKLPGIWLALAFLYSLSLIAGFI